MTITIEEVNKEAIKCGATNSIRLDPIATLQLGKYLAFDPEQLQAFAQRYIEKGRKMQRNSDAELLESTKEYKSFYMKDGKQKEIQHLMNMDTMRVIANAIRNNTGE